MKIIVSCLPNDYNDSYATKSVCEEHKGSEVTFQPERCCSPINILRKDNTRQILKNPTIKTQIYLKWL